MKNKRKSNSLSYKTSNRVRLPVEQLKPGMYVAEIDRAWEETTFLFQGFRLEDEDDVRTVQEQCKTVTIDIESSVEFQIARKTASKKKRVITTSSTKKSSIDTALPRAEKIHHTANKLVRNIIDDVRLGKSIDTPAAKEVVSSCVDSIMENPDAMTLLTRIRNKDEYTSEHSLSVSILSISLGRQAGLDRKQLNELGMSGMLHDVGKIMTPDQVLKKPGRLTDEEMDIMKGHPVSGRDILMSSDGIMLSALDVAHAHHERMDGRGYPRGLTKDQISPFSKIVAITDTFDAITSNRAYDKSRTNMEAFKILTSGRDKQWDAKYTFQFIQTIGIYSAGTLVELTNGEYAVVLETHPTLKLRPKVIIIPNDIMQSDFQVIDLAITKQDEAGNELNIKAVRSPDSVGIDMHALRELGILSKLNRAQYLSS